MSSKTYASQASRDHVNINLSFLKFLAKSREKTISNQIINPSNERLLIFFSSERFSDFHETIGEPWTDWTEESFDEGPEQTMPRAIAGWKRTDSIFRRRRIFCSRLAEGARGKQTRRTVLQRCPIMVYLISLYLKLGCNRVNTIHTLSKV